MTRKELAANATTEALLQPHSALPATPASIPPSPGLSGISGMELAPPPEPECYGASSDEEHLAGDFSDDGQYWDEYITPASHFGYLGTRKEIEEQATYLLREKILNLRKSFSNDHVDREFAKRATAVADNISLEGLTPEVVVAQTRILTEIKFSIDTNKKATHEYSRQLCSVAESLLTGSARHAIEERADKYGQPLNRQAVMEALGLHLEACLKVMSSEPEYGEGGADIEVFARLLAEASRHGSPQDDALQAAARDCTFMLLEAARHHEMEGELSLWLKWNSQYQVPSRPSVQDPEASNGGTSDAAVPLHSPDAEKRSEESVDVDDWNAVCRRDYEQACYRNAMVNMSWQRAERELITFIEDGNYTNIVPLVRFDESIKYVNQRLLADIRAVRQETRRDEFAKRADAAAQDISRKGLTAEVVMEQTRMLLEYEFAGDHMREASHEYSRQLCKVAGRLLLGSDRHEIEDRAKKYDQPLMILGVMEALGLHLELCLRHVSRKPEYKASETDIRTFATVLVRASRHEAPAEGPLREAVRECTFMLLETARHHELEGPSDFDNLGM